MKDVLHKIFAVIMAFTVLFSTTSFTIDMHYCGDSLVDSSVLSKAKSCGMETMSVDRSDCEVKKPNCCTNAQVVFEGQDELNISFDDLTSDEQLFLIAYSFTYINLFEGLEEQVVPFKAYSPPRVVKDIQKLDEVYII